MAPSTPRPSPKSRPQLAVRPTFAIDGAVAERIVDLLDALERRSDAIASALAHMAGVERAEEALASSLAASPWRVSASPRHRATNHDFEARPSTWGQA